MRIALITPARPTARAGNWHTARRWADLLRELGHRVRVETVWSGADADAMIALHARRSHDSIRRFARGGPGRPLAVVLTGTDLYRDIRTDAGARESLRLATRLVVLQDRGPLGLAPALRRKTRVIYQSTPPVAPVPPLRSVFEVSTIGHLRDEKDPFLLAAALAHLPAASRIRAVQIGAAMTQEYADAARDWERRERRYRWPGELPHGSALRRLARSRLLVVSSRMEGGANVISEAIAAGVPVLASRIPGNVGMLGGRYGGYFAVGDERRLARLLQRAENDPAFLRVLARAVRARRPLIRRSRERAALRDLLAGLA